VSGIVYDVYERRSKVPAMLAELAVPIEACRLAVGDYAIGRNVLVERKCVADLHQSIVRGRFWPQIGRLRIVALAPYLLVEGPDLDAGPLLPTAVRGCLVAAMDLGVHVIRSSEERDSAQWLHRILVRHGVRRPHLEKPA
jgi:ERCC4-type nuclease